MPKTDRFPPGFWHNYQETGRALALPVSPSFLVAAAVGAVVAQLEGRTLGLAALAHAVLAMAHLDLVEGTVLVLVVGAAVYGALDAGIGLVNHGRYLLVSYSHFEYRGSMPRKEAGYSGCSGLGSGWAWPPPCCWAAGLRWKRGIKRRAKPPLPRPFT